MMWMWEFARGRYERVFCCPGLSEQICSDAHFRRAAAVGAALVALQPAVGNNLHTAGRLRRGQSAAPLVLFYFYFVSLWFYFCAAFVCQ